MADGLVIAANQNPALANVYTTYGASTPQVYLKLDRERAETLGVSIGDIFSALQTTMGGTYVNDFNRFGRTWQVKVQADASDRKGVEDIFRVRVRTARDNVSWSLDQKAERVERPPADLHRNKSTALILSKQPAPIETKALERENAGPGERLHAASPAARERGTQRGTAPLGSTY